MGGILDNQKLQNVAGTVRRVFKDHGYEVARVSFPFPKISHASFPASVLVEVLVGCVPSGDALFPGVLDKLKKLRLNAVAPHSVLRVVGTDALRYLVEFKIVDELDDHLELDPIETKVRFSSWLADASIGDYFTYFRSGKKRDALTECSDYRELFDLVYSSSVNREVLLLRRRVVVKEEGRCFDYLAVKCSGLAPVRLFPRRSAPEFM